MEAMDRDVKYSKVQLKTFWEDFVTLRFDYPSVITSIKENRRPFIEIKHSDVSRWNDKMGEHLLDNPIDMIDQLEHVLKHECGFKVKARILCSTNKIHISNIRQDSIGHLIVVEGMANTFFAVKPKVEVGYFECARCHAIMRIPQEETQFKEPLECSKDPTMYFGEPGCGHSSSSTSWIHLDHMAEFRDYQAIELEEAQDMLENPRAQPQKLEVRIQDDLCGKISPGDRVIISGILVTRDRNNTKKIPVREYVLDALHMDILTDTELINISQEDEKEIYDMSKDPNLMQKLKQKACSSIYGHDETKIMMLLQQFGGVVKYDLDGTRKRGDIHFAMIGDPSTAKSQFLKWATLLAPKGYISAGKASTAGGLTAIAERDDSEFGGGRWRVKPGVLVKASGGLAAIDEFNRMSKEDKESIHYAMEQQEVPSNKAGLNITLKAECSIIAACNPILGRFDDMKSIPDQLGIDPAALTRFDIIHILQDVPDIEKDNNIACHIITRHMESRTERVNKLPDDILFLKKYILFARRLRPILTPEVRLKLAQFYSRKRNIMEANKEYGSVKRITLVPRNLDGMIRLTEASARMHLRNECSLDDAQIAIDRMEYFLKNVAVDAEGNTDIDNMETGKTASQKDGMNRIINFISEHQDDRRDGTTYQDIKEFCLTVGIEERQMNDLLDKCKRTGVYCPKEAHFRHIG